MTRDYRPPRALLVAAVALSLAGLPPFALCEVATDRDSERTSGRVDGGGGEPLLFPATNGKEPPDPQLLAVGLGGGVGGATVLRSSVTARSLPGPERGYAGEGGAAASVEASDSCASHLTCHDCTLSRYCHWCDLDGGTCHAIGSRYGCLRGEKCGGGKNDTTPEPTLAPTPPPSPSAAGNESGCSSHSNCKECASSTWNCHWCRDEQCHAVGSIHGCLRSESCDAPAPSPPPPLPPSKKNDTSSCASHATCSDCVLSSRLCRFCANDNRCHAVGSVHGCVSSVNCYSNDRCTRDEPEPIERSVFGQIGVLPALAIMGAGAVLLCCATACVSVVGCFSGAFDDLSDIAAGRADNDGEYEPPDLPEVEVEVEVEGSVMGDASEQVALMPPSSESGDGDRYEECDGEGDIEADDVDGEEGNGCDHDSEDEDEDEGEGEGADQEEETRPLHIEAGEAGGEDTNTRTPFLFWRSRERRPRRRSRPMSDVARCYRRCKICYAVAVVTVMVAVAASLVCFPKAPDYNVCNDQVAWKSIVDGMTSGKIEASFQLLMSVENPNHMAVTVDMGSGTFKHDGVEVGTFEIPTSTIGAMSITDVLVAVTFTPDKWQALALSTEYYKGTLKFAVDASATVVVPSLAGYTFSGGIENYIVHANDPKLQDRHLCVCPQWKDGKKDGPGPKLSGLFDFTAD